jgi:hypothetical protein
VTYRGGKFRVGYWTMTNHAGFGRLTGALPNGRKKGENFSSGITPASGATPDLPATLKSVASLPADHITNGMAFNVKYTPELDDRNRLDKFVGYVNAYFNGGTDRNVGGMEIQFNVTDHNTFLGAMEKPDPELLVRVSGYTAYFKDLNPQMQREIIERTEYKLSNGRMQSYDPVPSPPANPGINLDWIESIPGVDFVADKILESLLHVLGLSLNFERFFDKSVKNINGRYLFKTKDSDVAASMVFENGRGKVYSEPIKDSDLTVSFTDEAAFLEFLFSQDQDILNSLVKNDVAIEGNANYLYRFGFLARDLMRKFV